MEDALQATRSVIYESLFDGRSRDLVANLDSDFVITNRQRFVSTIGQSDDQGPQRLVVRSALKPSSHAGF